MPLRWSVLVVYILAGGLVIFLVGSRLGTEIFPKVEFGQLAVRLRGLRERRSTRPKPLPTGR